MATKTEKKEIILKTAETIFLKQGLFNTAMDQIAEEAGFTRRTLYRYFDKKEDLAYEVTTRLLMKLNEFYQDTYKSLEGNGLERLEVFLDSLIKYISDRVDIMNYIGEFDFYFKDTNTLKPSEDQVTHFNEVILMPDEMLKEILKLGIEDGSIKKGIDIEITEATISNVLWSFGQRIASRGNTIQQETGYDGIALIQYQVQLYRQALMS